LEILDADFAREKRLAQPSLSQKFRSTTVGLLDFWFEKLISWQWETAMGSVLRNADRLDRDWPRYVTPTGDK
jgi:hypothetical protein